LKRIPVLVCIILFLSMSTLSVYRTSAQPSTAIAVDPPVSTTISGSSFSVNVNVTNVVNFTSWQLNLYYVNAILSCTNAVEGSFLKSTGALGTYFSETVNDNYNSTCGCLSAYSTIEGDYSVNGNGVILTVNFMAVGAGISNLTLPLAESILGDNEIPRQPISHSDFSGTVNVTAPSHDVAVSRFALAKTVISRGYGGNITATAANFGGNAETFNVTVYANSSYISSANVTLSSGNSANVTFTWNTTGFAYGNYTISAYAWPVPGETNTANNNCTAGWVIVSLIGDVTGSSGWPDGQVNMRDVALIARAFGSTPGSSNWNPNSDLNNDGTVNMRDIALVARNFGQHI